jgi:hypothetical protein
MRREAERVVPAIEDDKLRLEKDITIDLEVTSRRLNTAKASYKKILLEICAKKFVKIRETHYSRSPGRS